MKNKNEKRYIFYLQIQLCNKYNLIFPINKTKQKKSL